MINKIGQYALIAFLWLVSLIPFPVIYIISDGLSFFLYYVIAYRKKIVYFNLTNSFPEKTPAEISAIAKKFYRHLADLTLEIIKMISMSEKEILKRFTVSNWDECKKIPESQRGLLGVVGHYGNWEWAGLALSIVAHPCPMYIIYKPLNNVIFNDFFLRIRSRTHSIMLHMNQVARKIVELKTKPYLLIFAADQSPQVSKNMYETTFLNQRTFVYEGIDKISRAQNAPLMFCDIQKVKRGYYKMDLQIIVPNPNRYEPEEITRIHVEKLENIIRNKPENWLWSHKRWKYSQAQPPVVKPKSQITTEVTAI